MPPTAPSSRAAACLAITVVAFATAGLPVRVQQSAAPVTPARFKSLRWLEGTWRGRMPNGSYFYERYAFANDSTISVSFLADSTLARVTRADSIALRGGRVRYDRATVTRLDGQGVAFGYGADTARGFTFARGRGGWTATIRSAGRDGRPRRTVYEMERLAP